MKILSKQEAQTLSERIMYLTELYPIAEGKSKEVLRAAIAKLSAEYLDAYHSEANFKLELIKGGK